MMDRKYIQTLVRMLLVTAALVSVSCTKEKETQRRAINEAVITGIDSVYAIRPDSLLRIAPEVTFTRDTAADTAHYTFEWIKLNQVGVYPYNPEVISSQPVLSYTFDWFLGAYRMALRVRDKRTNLFTESFFTLLITNDVYEGWLLLNDTGNGSRLDMLSYQAEADTFRTMIDVLALRSQVTLGPDPGFVTHAYLRAPRKERGAIVIGSGEDVIALDKDNLDNPASFRWLINGSQLRGNSSTLFPFNYWTFLWADGDIYVGEEDLNLCTYMRDAEGRNHRFKAAPFIAGYPFLARQPTVLYNQDEREFVWFALGLNYCHRFGKGSLFDYKTGKELVYLTFTFYEGGQYIALLRDHTDGKIYLARFTTARQLDYHELQLPGIAAAEHFAVSAKRGTLFYSNGGRLYQYDLTSRQHALMFDGGDQEVSLLKFHNFFFALPEAQNESFNFQRYNELQNHLIVCSYEPGKSASGTFMSFSVPEALQPLKPDLRYTGFGRIVSATYSER